jgi:gas vesicle protein
MSKGKFALGAVFGALVGGIAALLTAPKSGKETRDDLKKKADEVKKATEKKADEAKKKAEEVKGDLEAQAKDLRDRAESAVKGAKEGFNNPSTK